MLHLSRGLLVLALACSVFAPASSALDEPPPFTLAVLRRDGILVPFATFTGRRWTNPWPIPQRTIDVPITLRDVPDRWWGPVKPVPSWTVWTPDGPGRSVQAKAPVWFDAHCLRNVGLATDHESKELAPPPIEQPYPKDGLAASGPITLERIDVIDKSAPDWKQIHDMLTGPVNTAENEMVASYRRAGTWSHPIRPEARGDAPISLEALYRSTVGDPARAVYYFEAVKRYEDPKTQEKGCDLLTFASGWLIPDAGRSGTGLRAFAVATYCDMQGVEFLLPFGALRLDGNTLWIVQFSGWEGERYAIIDVTPTRMTYVINTFGGGC